MNTKSSTEAEVVVVSDYLLSNICIFLFMGDQGCDIKQNILFQGNHSELEIRLQTFKSIFRYKLVYTN